MTEMSEELQYWHELHIPFAQMYPSLSEDGLGLHLPQKLNHAIFVVRSLEFSFVDTAQFLRWEYFYFKVS